MELSQHCCAEQPLMGSVGLFLWEVKTILSPAVSAPSL